MQYHASRCDNTCTMVNGLRQGRTHTKSENSHALNTCYLSHVLITAQSTDSPEPQSCRAHDRQNHKLIILAKIPRTSSMLNVASREIFLTAQPVTNSCRSGPPDQITSPSLSHQADCVSQQNLRLHYTSSSSGCRAVTQLHWIYPQRKHTLTTLVSAVH